MLGVLLYPVKQFCYILLVLPSKNCPTLTQPPTSIAHCFVSQYTQDSDAGRDWGQEEKRTTEDEMAGWHHGLDGRESEWTPGAGDGQGGLACCDSWGCKESDTSEQLNWTELNWTLTITWNDSLFEHCSSINRSCEDFKINQERLLQNAEGCQQIPQK